jgi:hypothetical protein
MNRRRTTILLALALLLAAGALAQWGRRYRGVETAREADQNSVPTPTWTVDPRFKKDVFTFVRLRYNSGQSGSGWYRSGGGDWSTDFPDADLNLSWRLQQMTSLKVDPDGRVLDITDPALFSYPWVYMVEPGRLEFTEEEVAALRKYLLNGGFLMVDDFWGDDQWENFYREIKRVFPEREAEDLAMDHPIFHAVFPLKMSKQELQIPNVGDGTAAQWNGGVTWEWRWGPSAKDVHFKAFFDDQRRMMVFIAHNTDNGDGWEREGENEYYFREFAEKKAYPLGINVVFYAMTH